MEYSRGPILVAGDILVSLNRGREKPSRPWSPKQPVPPHPFQLNERKSETMSDWIEAGNKAPTFTAVTDTGKKVKLSDYKGKVVVLYFYPKDDTPGCTKEACAFRDASDALQKRGAVVLGVSPDDDKSHAKFRDKFSLNFPLLADPDHSIAEAYGAWREKNMYGKKSMGVQRSTYLIDSDGKVAKVWKRVSVDGHDAAVLEAIDELASR
nr:thioredoxin-dependent thiol peroxidase [Pirellula sp. SH-Sr6A]